LMGLSLNSHKSWFLVERFLVNWWLMKTTIPTIVIWRKRHSDYEYLQSFIHIASTFSSKSLDMFESDCSIARHCSSHSCHRDVTYSLMQHPRQGAPLTAGVAADCMRHLIASCVTQLAARCRCGCVRQISCRNSCVRQMLYVCDIAQMHATDEPQ
jgi:hypothetical protein